MKLKQLVISLTFRCNSRCLACLEWRTPKNVHQKELAKKEYQKIFKSWGRPIPYLTFVGGEVFLRNDLSQIAISAARTLKPKMINIATNGLLPEKIAADIEKILVISSKATIIANLSIDGTEKVHDKTRGRKGFLKKLMQTFQKLKKIQKKHQNLKIAFHTGVSTFNKNSIPELLKFLEKLNPNSYILEPCIDRTELLRQGVKIQISTGEFRRILKKNKTKIWQLNKKVSLPLRLVRIGYYPFALEVMEEDCQVIPCQAAQSSLFLDPYGNLLSCELKNPFANLADFNYNLKKAYFSKVAKEERKKIKDNQCFCHTSFFYYSSIKKAPFYLLKSLLKLSLL